MLQLNPPIPLVTPRGKGYAHMVIDYSQEHDLLWVVFLDESRECWTFSNQEVRIQENATLGRHGRVPLPVAATPRAAAASGSPAQQGPPEPPASDPDEGYGDAERAFILGPL